jgi:hypothetical protein
MFKHSELPRFPRLALPVWSKNSADVQTQRITAFPASRIAGIVAELGQITTRNIRHKTHRLHAVDELTA